MSECVCVCVVLKAPRGYQSGIKSPFHTRVGRVGLPIATVRCAFFIFSSALMLVVFIEVVFRCSSGRCSLSLMSFMEPFAKPVACFPTGAGLVSIDRHAAEGGGDLLATPPNLHILNKHAPLSIARLCLVCRAQPPALPVRRRLGCRLKHEGWGGVEWLGRLIFARLPCCKTRWYRLRRKPWRHAVGSGGGGLSFRAWDG